ncbi:tetratricopeptide repeat-containing sensor histidine kinase [Mangrovimonas cancribranchiae]|uniref:histidine kinase n=1 Tax=Mangrovimonas cancribranchiae TaxID=3080055 RepID=A0AAU6P3D8_9FLAO
MKPLLTSIFLLVASIICAQDLKTQPIVNELNTQIQLEKSKAKKLKLLDSLTATVRNKTDFAYDSIARKTIDYAILLDSFNIAAYNTTNLINYHNNILGNPEEGIVIFNNYFNTLKNKISYRNIASLYIDSGDSFYFIKQVDSAMSHYSKAIAFAKKAKDQRVEAMATLYQGYAYTDEGNFVKASQTLQKASKIFNTVKDTFNIIASKNALSLLYSSNGFLTEAREERIEAISLAEKIKSYGQLIPLYVNEATDNKKQNLETQRIKYLHKAIAANKKSNYFDYFKPILLNELIVAYAENDSINKANFYLKEIEKDKRNTEGIYKVHYYNALKSLAYANKQYSKAETLGNEHLNMLIKTNDINTIQKAEEFLGKVYEALNKPKQSLTHYKVSQHILDSIKSVQKTKALAYYQTLYETEKRDQKIKLQNSKITLLDEQNKRKKQLLWFGGLSLVALFIILYLWRSNKFSKRKAKLEKAFAQDLIRNVETERKRISSELHDSVGQSLLLIKNKILLDSDETTDMNLIDNTIDEVRSISQNLHPFQFEKLGLIASIENTVESFQKSSDIFYSEDIDIQDLNIPKDKEIFIYRMIQECLNNVEKHSQAKACNVMAKDAEKYVLFQIKDNGIGFDLTENSQLLNSLGMKTLKERAQIIQAQLSINSEKGKGTTIQIQVPKK